MIIAFTGHRPTKLGGYYIPNATYDRIVVGLITILSNLQPEKAISGMALGLDQWAADLCHKREIPFIATVPFSGQEKFWPPTSQDTYRQLLEKAQETVVVSEGNYTAHKMQLRNEWMVDRCDKLVAVFDGTTGGTSNCIKYAEKIGKEIVRLNPLTWEITGL